MCVCSLVQLWSHTVTWGLPAKPLPPAVPEPVQRQARFKLQRPVSRTPQHSRCCQRTGGPGPPLGRARSPVLTCAPGNPSSVMSPAGPASLEDQQYMEKLKQLSKYIEPLRRMINKIDKNEGRGREGGWGGGLLIS